MQKFKLTWKRRENGDLTVCSSIGDQTCALAHIIVLPTAEGVYFTKADFFRSPADIDSGKLGRQLSAAKLFDGSVADIARAWLEHLIRAYCSPDTVEFFDEQKNDQNEDNKT